MNFKDVLSESQYDGRFSELINPNLQVLLLEFGLIGMNRSTNYETFTTVTVDVADVKQSTPIDLGFL